MLQNVNIRLRALEVEDIDLLYKWENDDKLWHLSNTTKPFSKYVLEQYILNSHLDIYEFKQLRLMIVQKNKNTEKAVGCIDLFDFDPANLRAGVGVFIEESYRNQSLGSKALHILKDYCHNSLHLNQLYCSITPDNKASIKVFENAGFICTGKRLKWIRKGKKWLDELFYQYIY